MELQQKRHVVVHRLGILDRRAVKEWGLPSSSIGKRLSITAAEVKEGVVLARKIGEHLKHKSSTRC